ncbi:MAG: ABC-type cobalamin/Fe3+-siderophores transport system ATPase subunit [Candidatus Paceibacteria bacterium]
MVIQMEGKSLSFSYGESGVRALDGIQLEVHAGEMVAVLGPNGAGKSTLLKLLGGLLRPSAGLAEVEGKDVASWSARERAQRLAMVPQSLTTLPEVTVEAFVGYGRYAHRGVFDGPQRADAIAIADALERADLNELAQRPLAELSGGQRQRALIARALAQEARALLVDEPTNALDPEHQLRVFDLLADLCDQGRSVVVVTHELNLASQYADRALLLHGGKQVALAAVSQVLRAEVLEPVYGSELEYGRLPAGRAGEERPFVLPWRSSK